MQNEKPPEPFKVSEQYKSSWQNEDESPEPKKVDTSSSKLKAKPKAKNSKRKKSKKGKPMVPATSKQKRFGEYQPEAYKKARVEYISEKRSQGASYAVANGAWNLSAEKAKLLSAVPVCELVRRRFLPKGSKENPWATN